jgi:hypothetical protein
MQIGVITVDGRPVGVVSWTQGEAVLDPVMPDLDGYVPQGRASEREAGEMGSPRIRHHAPAPGASSGHAPRGEIYTGSGGRPVRQGSAEVDQAVVDAARAHHLDPNTMRAIASIESGMNPSSNAHRSTQYKGLYQIGRSEWERFGAGGNIYAARDNAFAAARMFEANRAQFKRHYGRDPTDAELYMMHQQGLGFYTRGAMTNVGGNPYPGMHGPQSHESFEAGWGREVARRKAAFAGSHPSAAEATFDPQTMVP